MKDWKQVANYSLVDNRTLQAWGNRVGLYVAMCFLTPLIMFCPLFLSGAWLIHLTRQTFWLSIIFGPTLVFLAVLGYGYYVPKGYRKYFYVACAVPAVLGFFLTVACVITVLIHGMPKL